MFFVIFVEFVGVCSYVVCVDLSLVMFSVRMCVCCGTKRCHTLCCIGCVVMSCDVICCDVMSCDVIVAVLSEYLRGINKSLSSVEPRYWQSKLAKTELSISQ